MYAWSYCPRSHLIVIWAKFFCMYDWLPSVPVSCDGFLQSSLPAFPKSQWRGQKERSQVAATERTPSGFWGLAVKDPSWIPSKILAQSICSMGCLQPPPEIRGASLSLGAGSKMLYAKALLRFQNKPFSASLFEGKRDASPKDYGPL